LDGKTYRRGMTPMDASIFRADDRTLLVGTDALLHKVLSNHAAPKEGKMSKLLGSIKDQPDATAIVLMEPLRPLAATSLAMAPLPPPLADVPKLPELITSIGLKVNLTAGLSASLAVRANDEAAAEKIEQIVDKLLATARQQAAAATAEGLKSSDPVEQANAKYGQRMSEQMLPLLRPVRKGNSFTLAADLSKNPQLASVTTIGMLVGLLLPAVQAAREAARRAQSINNLKQIGLAMHNFHSVQDRFPARAVFDKQGKPLLSWRVQILPYLEEQALYNQFHLDEPWDSEHNRKLIPLMPAVYQNPSVSAQPGMASYLAVCGKGLAFDGDKGRRLADFTNGTSRAILVVEADPDRAVTWTKPDDWQYNADKPLAGLGQAHPGGVFNVLFADGSVHTIFKTMDPKAFYALLTIARGEAVNPDNLEQ
jgi:prepilin-type processing-associated H-X9-DG protein